MALINKITVGSTTYDIQDRLMPDSIGTAGQVLKVNSSRSGLEFANESGGSDITVVQNTGQSTTDVMSQKAVTDELNEIFATVGEAVTPSGIPSTATSGTFTTAEWAKLQANKNNYILFNNEIYRLADTGHEGTTDIWSYVHNGWDGSATMDKSINVTVSNGSWVLVQGLAIVELTGTSGSLSDKEVNALKGNHAIIKYKASASSTSYDILVKNSEAGNSSTAVWGLYYSNVSPVLIGNDLSIHTVSIDLKKKTWSYATNSSNIPKFSKLTQSEYDNLTTKDANTIYLIVN